LKDYPFNKEKHQMTKWNTTIAAASLLAALCPGGALAQVVEYVDGQGQKHQVGSRAPGLSSASQPGDVPSLSSETSGQDREPASQKPNHSKADKEFADQQRDAVRRNAPEKTKQVCRWAPGAPDASSSFSVSRSCK
jgi:hypothetical protein